MKLEGLHLLLSYRCLFECDHCFVWGSPGQSGTMTVAQIHEILRQGKDLGSVEWVYFEGGEPFLYYPVLATGINFAKALGFRVGLVSNAYWATNEEDAIKWLEPFAGALEDLSISCDLYHAEEQVSVQASNARAAAQRLAIPVGLISVAQPSEMNSGASSHDKSALRYRGRAAEVLTQGARLHSWETFSSCPYEQLQEPSRVHLDSFGYVQVCQGIAIGNLFEKPLKRIVEDYQAETHPIIGPLIEGGPAALYQPEFERTRFADACHLCFTARKTLRERFPEMLAPTQMYGIENP